MKTAESDIGLSEVLYEPSTEKRISLNCLAQCLKANVSDVLLRVIDGAIEVENHAGGDLIHFPENLVHIADQTNMNPTRILEAVCDSLGLPFPVHQGSRSRTALSFGLTRAICHATVVDCRTIFVRFSYGVPRWMWNMQGKIDTWHTTIREWRKNLRYRKAPRA